MIIFISCQSPFGYDSLFEVELNTVPVTPVCALIRFTWPWYKFTSSVLYSSEILSRNIAINRANSVSISFKFQGSYGSEFLFRQYVKCANPLSAFSLIFLRSDGSGPLRFFQQTAVSPDSSNFIKCWAIASVFFGGRIVEKESPENPPMQKNNFSSNALITD